jgi:ligand-binding sensor domain-containing protein
VTSWTETEAGPLGAVSDIVQDRDGYLWIGTSVGLFRFDGTRFKHWDALGDTRLPASPVSSLTIARDGTLWVGFANRAGVARIQGRSLDLTDAGQMRIVSAIVEDRQGAIWAVGEPSLFRLSGRAWERVRVGSGSDGPRVVNAGVTAGGGLWVGTTSGLFLHRPDHSFARVASDWVWSVSEDDDGVVWLTDTVKGFRRQHETTDRNAAVEGNGYRLRHDRYGDLWIGTIGEGLWRVRSGFTPARIEKATLGSALFSDAVQAVFEDREGNLWVGTTVGLHRLTRQPLTPLTNVGLVTAAEAAAGDVWAGTNYGVVRFRERDGTWVGRRLDGPPTYVNTMHRDRFGAVWVGAVEGLRRIDGDRLRAVAVPAEFGPSSVTCLSSDPRGGLWLGNGSAVLHWDRNRFTPLVLPDAAPGRRPACVHHDARERLWIGFPGARLSLRDESGSFRHFGPDTFGPEATTISGVFESSDGTIWVPTNAGVTRFNDQGIYTFRRAHGLPSDRVWSVVEDDQHHLWLSLDVGVVRVDPAEFERAASRADHRIRYQSFDTSDGLAGAPILRVRSGRGAGGALWFLRGGALTVGSAPLRVPSMPADGPVHIESGIVDERAVDTSRRGDLPAGTKRLQIDFTAIALTQPGRVRFRYKLDGFDTEWIQAGTRRSAIYTNLPPRAYRFVVEAGTDRDGWRGGPAAWDFTVAPAFYQTWWFSAGALLTAGMLVWGAWRFRVGLMHREYAAVLAERTRLSREIHDTLLQGVVGVALQLDAIAHSVGSISADAKEALLRTRRQVETYIREARQSIFDLRSPLLETRSLPDVLTQIGTDATDGSPVTFSLAVTGRVRGCPPRLENELLRIGQEAITNAIRHAHARRIQLELHYEHDAVALTVVDDGRGIDSGRDDTGVGEAHYGLIVMKERAENLGGRVSIAPLPEGGTKIEAVLPAPAAA